MTRFQFRKIAHDDPLINEVYRLRYKVYCDEWGFEKPEDHPGGLEIDEYDRHSVHMGAFCRESGRLIGTIRLILNSELGFPIEKHCTLTADLSGLTRDTIAEISRLAVSKEFRKRAVDGLIYNDGTLATEQRVVSDVEEKRKHEFHIIMGLYLCMYLESRNIGLTHWFAVMAKGLRILLNRMKIRFSPIGPEVDYHGLRVPYLGAIDDIVKGVSTNQSELLRDFRGEILGEGLADDST
ncbi:MAG: PEP-CTERM/exosortase system-associated acyltransferase [Geobacteraceae bacterium]|nr:PEP-CTERM/exosortase system-associated acyltransferase [Geobacteraceae bacterium]